MSTVPTSWQTAQQHRMERLVKAVNKYDKRYNGLQDMNPVTTRHDDLYNEPP